MKFGISSEDLQDPIFSRFDLKKNTSSSQGG
jgi:hypothetical protein